MAYVAKFRNKIVYAVEKITKAKKKNFVINLPQLPTISKPKQHP